MAYIQQQNLIRPDYADEETVKKQSVFRRILSSHTTIGLTFVTLFSVSIPLLIYYFVIDQGNYKEADRHTCLVNRDYMISCGRRQLAHPVYCQAIGCCFDNSTETCYHYVPSKYFYSLDPAGHGYNPSLPTSPFDKKSSNNVALGVIEESPDHVRFILYDPSVEQITDKFIPATNKSYVYQKYDDPLAVQVNRTGTNITVLTTTLGPLIVSEFYWEWSFHLTDQYLFGLGETLIEVDKNFTLSKVIYPNKDDHNTVPVFMAYRDGQYHGLVVEHSGPLEVTVLPSKLVSLKSLAGTVLELSLYLGPTPQDIFRQQGRDGFELPEPWALGVHVCRGGSSTDIDLILDEFEHFLTSTVDNTNHYVSDCIHENLVMAMFRMNDVQKNRLRQNIASLYSRNLQFILSVPPQIHVNNTLYDQLHDTLPDVFYKKSPAEAYTGTYLEEEVAYPYFGHASIDDFLKVLLDRWNTILGALPDNFILNSNWPAEETYNLTNTDVFQYMSEDLREAMSFTLPWNTTNSNQTHLVQHNNYGHLHLTSFLKNLNTLYPTKRPFVMAASQKFDTTHSLIIQNVDPSWLNFRKTIRTVLYNSMFVNPLISAPVCGSTSSFDPKIHESLCMRWYLMAATSPIFRISSDFPRRDPDTLNTLFAANTARYAIEIRNQLQVYFYTILAGKQPLMRPMFYDFFDDNVTFALDQQYMIGNRLLVAHPVLPDLSTIRIYLPLSVNVWFELWGGRGYPVESRHEGWISFNVVENDWISFVAEGSVVPLIKSSGSDMMLKIIVALSCTGNACKADGHLLFGTSNVVFDASETNFSIKGLSDSVMGSMDCANINWIVDQILVYKNGAEPVAKNGLNVSLCSGNTEISIAI